MQAPEFIDEILIGQIGRIQNIGKKSGNDCHYLSFSLICTGIEFLGACLDSDSFEEKDKSQPRFNNAIQKLFPKGYRHNKVLSILYGSLRCGIVHVALPNSNIGLTQEKESLKNVPKHLDVNSYGRLFLVSETFFNDFKEACEEIKRRIKDGELVHTKLAEDILFVPSENILDANGQSITPSASGCGEEW